MSQASDRQSAELRIIQASTSGEIEHARELFREYGAIPEFGVCFKGFEEETRALPGMYAPPAGRLLVAYVDSQAAGCVGLRRMEESVCEIRRLYVRPRFRGFRLGRALSEAILNEARDGGYRTVCLGTLPVMKEAIALYQSLGFVEAKPYKAEALSDAIYMELALK